MFEHIFASNSVFYYQKYVHLVFQRGFSVRKCSVDNLSNRIGLSLMFNLRLHTCFVLTIFSFWLIVMYKLWYPHTVWVQGKRGGSSRLCGGLPISSVVQMDVYAHGSLGLRELLRCTSDGIEHRYVQHYILSIINSQLCINGQSGGYYYNIIMGWLLYAAGVFDTHGGIVLSGVFQVE